MPLRRKLLFVCSRNRWRSPTAERIFDGVNHCAARSAGTEPGARVRVSAGHLGWADLIFVMEKNTCAGCARDFRRHWLQSLLSA